MTPGQYTYAKQELARLLGKKGIDVGFPTARTVEGGKRVIGTMTYEKYGLKGILKPRLYRTGFYGEYSKPIFQATKDYWQPGLKSIYRGFTRRIGERTWVGDTRILTTKATGFIPSKGKIPIRFPWTEKQFVDITVKDITQPIVRTKIYTYIPRTTYFGKGMKDIFMKPGKLITAFRGKPQETLVGFVKPLPKKWIQKISTRKIPGLLSVGELAPPKTIYRPISTGITRTGMIPGAITIPSGFFISPVTPLAYAYFGTTIGSLTKTRQKIERITVPSTIQKRKATVNKKGIE